MGAVRDRRRIASSVLYTAWNRRTFARSFGPAPSVFQEPAFKMSRGPAHSPLRQCFDPDPTFVLFQTTNGVLEQADLVDRVVVATRKASLGDVRHDPPRRAGPSARFGAVSPQRRRSLSPSNVRLVIPLCGGARRR